MSGTVRRGLRAQILLALFAAVVLAFGLLDLVATRLGEHARITERTRAAEASAALLAEVASSPWLDLPRFQRLADSMIGHGGVRGLEVVRQTGPVFARGAPGAGREVVARGADGVLVRLFVELDDAGQGRRQAEFLLLYIVLTGGAILLLTYVSLTMLVVRPVERLRRASERLARGQLATPVEAGGPAELEDLARAFNDMATQLRADREALVARLAELERTTTHLRDAQEQIVRTEKLASVGRLSAGVAHEIGNPLAAILGLVELLESGDLPPDEAHEFIRRIRAETERIHRIIRELLDFASQGRDSDDELGATADVVAVAREAIALVKPQKAFRGVELVLDAPPAVPRLAASESRLAQVMLNLLLNAADAIDGAGRVVVRIEALETAVVITVEDDGPGIDPAVLPKLFEPFVTTKAVGKGTGLGLAVCHTIATRLGGSIHAENRVSDQSGTADTTDKAKSPRSGARFVLSIPLSKTSQEA